MADGKMKDFSYTATNPHQGGKTKTGVVTASSDKRAYQILSAQGLTPIKIVQKNDNLMNKDFQIPGFEKKAKLKALTIFTKQFSLMVKAGIPMLQALKAASTQTEDPVLKVALEEVADDVESGGSLSAAMEKRPLAFPGLLSSVVSVGEESGSLDAAFEGMAKTYKTEMNLKRKVKTAMTYPIIVLSITLLVVTGMMIFVVPQFKKMFADVNAEMPIMTQILINVSDNAFLALGIFLATLLTFTIAYRHYIKEDWLLSRVDKLKISFPVFGPLMVKVAIARFSRNLSMMLDSGVALVPALKLVGKTSENYHLRAAIEASVQNLENGGSLSQSIDGFSMFPTMVKNMIVIGESSGELSVMLDFVGDFYDEEVEEASEQLASAIEPLMIVVLGVVIGGMLFALYTPMFTIFTKVSEGG